MRKRTGSDNSPRGAEALVASVVAGILAGCGAAGHASPTDASVAEGGSADGSAALDSNPLAPGVDSGQPRYDGGGSPGKDAGSASADSGSLRSDGGLVTGDSGGAAATCDASVGPGDRVITITNECPSQTIQVGVNGGYVEDCTAGACPAGTTCNTTRSPPGCFWDFPTPSCGERVLAAGASATYVLSNAAITAPSGGSPIKWSGNVYAATMCASDGTGCQTGECATSSAGKTVVGACPNGVGPQGPATLAEFTLAPNGSDFYDISTINGVNVPISMVPTGGATDPSNPYTCGRAGAPTATTGLVSCSWQFDTTIDAGSATDESTVLRAVAPGGASCATDSDCSSGDVCGTALSFGSSAASQSCGKQVAWWTADELCMYTGNTFGAPLNCNQAVAGQGTNANLYGCNGSANATSCSSAGAGATCCGCPDWVIGGTPLSVGASSSCKNDNPEWQSIAEPWAAFVKNACPTAYSFPFDDATSTFTCTTPNPGSSNPNSVGYTITFCPGGVSGF